MSDLVKRLLDADWNSQQRFLGSRIFGEAADRISQQDAELERVRRELAEAESERVRLWNENRDLRGSLDVEKAATDSVKRELAEARAKLFPYADVTEISGISFDGKYLIGDKKSISYFHEMKNRGEQIDVYARAYEQRIAAAEAKITEEQEARAILEGHLSAAIDDYNDALKALRQITSVKAEVSNERFRFFALATADAALAAAKAEETRT